MYKPKTCAICRERFTPARQMQPTCGFECHIKYADRVLAKSKAKLAIEERKADKARKDKLDGRKVWLKKAEAAVNRYVKLRDWAKGCISCHLPADWDGRWNASHFRSVGAASTVRYHLWNIHKACVSCNKFKGGNIADYEPRLRALIGDAKVDWLKAQNHRAEYDVAYLQRLAKVFNKKARRQEKRK